MDEWSSPPAAIARPIAWDVATGQQLRSYDEGHAYLASAALFFPDGKHVLTSAVDNTTRIWDMATGTQLATLDGTGTSAAVALAHDGQVDRDRQRRQGRADLGTRGKLLRKFAGFTSDVTAVAISPDDQYVLAGDGVGRCRLLRSETGESVWESRSQSRGITAAAFVPGQNRLLTASIDNTVAQWDGATGHEDRSRLLKHPDAVTSLAVSHDGRQALTACADKIVRLWDVERAEVLRTLPAGPAATTDVAFSPDGQRA